MSDDARQHDHNGNVMLINDGICRTQMIQGGEIARLKRTVDDGLAAAHKRISELEDELETTRQKFRGWVIRQAQKTGESVEDGS